jgi:hypothetical protein
MKKLKDILKESLGELPSSKLKKMKWNPVTEADVFGDPSDQDVADAAKLQQAVDEKPKDVEKLVDRLKNNQGIKLAVKKINMKNEVGPAIIAFAQMLNDQVPGALTSSRRQYIIKAMKEME